MSTYVSFWTRVTCTTYKIIKKTVNRCRNSGIQSRIHDDPLAVGGMATIRYTWLVENLEKKNVGCVMPISYHVHFFIHSKTHHHFQLHPPATLPNQKWVSWPGHFLMAMAILAMWTNIQRQGIGLIQSRIQRELGDVLNALCSINSQKTKYGNFPKIILV